jgi:hypothetical protein
MGSPFVVFMDISKWYVVMSHKGSTVSLSFCDFKSVCFHFIKTNRMPHIVHCQSVMK